MADGGLALLCKTVIQHQNGAPDKFSLSQMVTNILLDTIQSVSTAFHLCHMYLTKLVSGRDTKGPALAFVE